MLVTFTFPALDVMSSWIWASDWNLAKVPTQKALFRRDLLGLTVQSTRLHWSLGTPGGVNALPRLFLVLQIAGTATQVQGNRTHSAKPRHLGINYGSWHHWILLLVQLLLKGPRALFTPPGVFWGLQQRVCGAVKKPVQAIGATLMSDLIPLPACKMHNLVFIINKL